MVLLAAPWLLSASDLPVALFWPMLAGVWGIGLAQLVVALRRPRHVLLLCPPPEPLQLDGQPLSAPTLRVQGPWLLLGGKAGHRQRLLFWPDVLDRAQRRELRLAVAIRSVSRRPRTMAP
ncbi:hypothetical protein [Stenotrophomonas sp. 24(2023)]|uniref:hypothetical protein n=1 Tax=Stenotrophomonas sp. 24(2023) TaxID=3068324 RepID=UPI0027DF4349|nr:hypothetical protein [Stenotrophomonas sp. 24(2023)]WMJ71506.1 hypothetical protein Q9R17_16525 [Stenotrophomonas sp. 24(2023)]